MRAGATLKKERIFERLRGREKCEHTSRPFISHATTKSWGEVNGFGMNTAGILFSGAREREGGGVISERSIGLRETGSKNRGTRRIVMLTIVAAHACGQDQDKHTQRM